MRAAALLLLLAGPALADDDPGQALEAERDQLIDRIVRGVDVAPSVQRFGALAQRRKELIAAREKAIDDRRAAEEKRAADRAAAERWQSDYTGTLDYAATISCRFAVDVMHPPAVPYSSRGLADWGRVVRKEALVLPRAGALLGGPATLYEIEGRVRRYRVEVTPSSSFPDFSAERGDLVMVCDHDVQHDRRAPPEWNPFQYQGVVARIAHPPKIVQKGRWNPAHLSFDDVRRAIYAQRWPLAPGQKALLAFVADEDLGNGRWRAKFFSGASWTILVPPSLRARLTAGHQVWAILGDAIWEGKEKLVLPVEDLEERYVD